MPKQTKRMRIEARLAEIATALETEDARLLTLPHVSPLDLKDVFRLRFEQRQLMIERMNCK